MQLKQSRSKTNNQENTTNPVKLFWVVTIARILYSGSPTFSSRHRDTSVKSKVFREFFEAPTQIIGKHLNAKIPRTHVSTLVALVSRSSQEAASHCVAGHLFKTRKVGLK